MLFCSLVGVNSFILLYLCVRPLPAYSRKRPASNRSARILFAPQSPNGVQQLITGYEKRNIIIRITCATHLPPQKLINKPLNINFHLYAKLTHNQCFSPLGLSFFSGDFSVLRREMHHIRSVFRWATISIMESACCHPCKDAFRSMVQVFPRSNGKQSVEEIGGHSSTPPLRLVYDCCSPPMCACCCGTKLTTSSKTSSFHRSTGRSMSSKL